MGIVIDSSVFIRSERLRQPVDLSRWRQHGTPFISAVTVSELLVGVHRANTASRKEARFRLVEATLASTEVLDFDASVARTHAVVHADTQDRGTPVGSHDLLIAATALEHGATLVPNNVREFARVPGPMVEDWLN